MTIKTRNYILYLDIYLNDIDFLFLTRVSNLGNFLCMLDDLLIKNTYQGLAKLFSLNLPNNITTNNTNFITNILIDNNIKYLSDDNNLKILNSSILTYLTNIQKTTSNPKYKELALKGINYINETTKKYNEITKLLFPYYDLVAEKTNKQLEILENCQRKFIKEYSYLLSEKGKKIIKEQDEYNVKSLLKKEWKFKAFFKLSNEDAIWGLNEFISINDIFSIKRMSNDPNILTKLVGNINKYNQLIKKEVEEYEFTITKSEIKNYFINKLKKSNEKDEIIEIIVNSITNSIYNHSSNFFQFYSKTIVLEPLSAIYESTYQNKFINSFYHLITHELYHALDLPKNIFINPTNPKKEFPIIFDDKYEMLYEAYTEYRAITKTCNLINEGHFFKQDFVNNIHNSIYNDLFFILLDFFEEYPEEFKICIEENNLKSLTKLLRTKEIERLIKIINSFNKENFDTDLKYATNITKTIDKYQKRAKIRQKIRKIIKYQK